MYKCLDCGNTEKFIGNAKEKGSAYIYRDNFKKTKKDGYTWMYTISDNSWHSKFSIKKCYYCKSTRIVKI